MEYRRKLRNAIQKFGYIQTVQMIFSKLFDRGVMDPILERRQHLSCEILDLTSGVVAGGPYRGINLRNFSKWDVGCNSSKLLGTYEIEVSSKIQSIGMNCELFVNLGAGEGYHVIGALKSSGYKSSVCFEEDLLTQETLVTNLRDNSLEDRVEILGRAESNWYECLEYYYDSKNLILIDVEGAESELLDDRVLTILKNSVFIIELHPWIIDGIKWADFTQKIAQTHNLVHITTGYRSLAEYEFLKNWSDSDRWLSVSEGRPNLMEWIQLTPKIPNS